MAELKITEFALGRIDMNFDELKGELTEAVKDYKGMVVTPDQVVTAKQYRARLNALEKSLNDERLRREREFLEPFNVFKNQVNELRCIIKEASDAIDTQVKAYEEQQKAEKKAEIEDYYNNEVTHPEWLTIDKIFDQKWLNASVSMAKIKEQINDIIKKIIDELLVVEEMKDFSFEAKEVYKESLDLGRAMAEGKRLADIQKRKEAEQEAKKILAEKVRGQETASDAEIEAFEQRVINDKAEEEKVQNSEVKRYWVTFEANLTVTQAKALKTWFECENIEYKAKRN